MATPADKIQEQNPQPGPNAEKSILPSITVGCKSSRSVLATTELTAKAHRPMTRGAVHLICGNPLKLVPSAPARLDQFLCASGVAPDERVSAVSDDAGEFGKAVDGSQVARGRILDWFHIAKKFKVAKNSVLGSQTIEPDERIAVETEIDHAMWLVWHGKGRQAVFRIKALDATLLAREGYEHSTLYWNLRRLYFYIECNAGTLVNYGMRYNKGLRISSSIAESAVNLVVSHRMAKEQQMRWMDGRTGERTVWHRSELPFSTRNSRLKNLLGLTKTSVTPNSPSTRRAA